MKKTIQQLLAAGAFASVALFAHAQPAPKICVVDVAKVFDSHWKTQDQMAKLHADQASAQQQYDQMTKDLNALKAGIDELVEQSKNPTATADAVKKAQDDAQKKYDDLQARLNERNNFQATVQREFQQRTQSFQALMIDEIGQKATEVAKRRGATLLLDKPGITHSVIYSDPAYDVTDEVMAEIAKDKPATPAPAPAAAPAAATPQVALPPIAAPAK